MKTDWSWISQAAAEMKAAGVETMEFSDGGSRYKLVMMGNYEYYKAPSWKAWLDEAPLRDAPIDPPDEAAIALAEREAKKARYEELGIPLTDAELDSYPDSPHQ